MKHKLFFAMIALSLLISACGAAPAEPSNTFVQPQIRWTIQQIGDEMPPGLEFRPSTSQEISDESDVLLSGFALALAEPTFVGEVIFVGSVAYYVYVGNKETIDNAVSGLAEGTYQRFTSVTEWLSMMPGVVTSFGQSAENGSVSGVAEIAEGLIPASKKTENGEYAYYGPSHDAQKCWSGVSNGQSWFFLDVDTPCPNGPDDDEGFARLLRKMGEHPEWRDLVKRNPMDKRVLFVRAVGRMYGLTLP